jgi:hypothetical protein
MAGEEEAYCVKCQSKKPMKNSRKTVIKNKNGKNQRHALRGECSHCGTKMVKFVKAD